MNKLSMALLAAGLLGVGCENDSKPGADMTPACDPTVPGTICTIAGTGTSAYSGDGELATKATLYTPNDVAVAPNGDLWIADFNNYLFRAIDSTGIINTVIGVGFLGDSPDPPATTCPALEAKFNHTPSMFFDGKGFVYLASWHNSRVKRVELDTMSVTNFAGVGKRLHYSGDEGPALDAFVDLPSSVAQAPNGDIVFMDQANETIRRVDSAGVIHALVGTCETESYQEGSPVCTKGTTLIHCPDSDKTTYCADPNDPTVTTQACGWACTAGFSGDGGPALAIRMGQPTGQAADPSGRIAYDKAGNLYFTDTGNHRIRKVDTSGIVTTIAGSGTTAGYSGDGGPATAAQLNHPVDLAIAEDNTLYFTDTQNNCVRKIDPSGTISRVAGDCTTAGACGVACLIVDNGNTCKSDASICFGGDGGDPLKAKLNRPYGLELAGKRLYIADSYNNRVRVVNLP